MRRRAFIAGLGSAVAWPMVARGQQPERMPQITIWVGRAEDAEGHRHATAFREGLRALSVAPKITRNAEATAFTAPVA